MSPSFLDLDDAGAEADAILLPLPYQGTVSYGRGTAEGPQAIWDASAQIELWDEETGFDLGDLGYHTAPALWPQEGEGPASYLDRVYQQASHLHTYSGLLCGIGGEHGLTPPLVRAAYGEDLSGLTVVQLDAHADLRPSYGGTPHSHACAMRRLCDDGASLLAVGLRSAEAAEATYAAEQSAIRTFWAHQLQDPAVDRALCDALLSLQGDVYLTIDIDALEVHLCPATGTPQPGGLGWWQALRYIRCLLRDNNGICLRGCDLVETAPMPHTRVNEFVAARLLGKVLAYYFCGDT